MCEFKIIPSQPRYEINQESIIRVADTKKIKQQYIGSTGYYMISCSYNNKTKPLRVHRLLAETFIPNPNNLPDINHKNGIKTDNSIDNLEWCTHLENMQHAFKTGLANNTGEKNGQAKLNKEQVQEIRKLLADGISQYKIAKLYPVSRSAILGIKIGRLWANV
jgi:hypothetical protein